MAPSKPLRAFAVGASGTLSVYAVWFLRNAAVVDELFASRGGASSWIAAGALAAVAAAGGAWALLSGAKSLRSAFSVGLGVPSLLFAGDLAGGVAATTAPAADAPAAYAPEPPRSPWSLVLSPVTTVARTAQTRAAQRSERAIERDLKAIAPAATGAISAALRSDDPARREAAAHVLSRMGPAARSAAAELERAGADDPSPRVKASAMEAARRVRAAP